MTKDKILRDLKAIYWQARKNNKWNVVLWALEQKEKYTGILEKQSPPSQRLPEVMRIEDMTEGQLRDYIAALEKIDPDLKKLDPDLKHPPPLTRT